jgi:hypothetical protein
MPTARDTKYATLIHQSVLKFPKGGEARIERLRIKSSDNIEIRMSWWKDGKMMMRPLDLGENDFLKLLAQSMREGVLLCDHRD